MKIHQLTVLGFMALALMHVHPLNAAVVVFDNNASFDANFYKPSGPGGAPQLSQTGSSLHFTPATGQTNATAIYNTSTTGGRNGSGGTSLGTSLDLFNIDAAGMVIEADFRASNFDTSNGIGLYFGLNETATNGALAIFRTSATTGSGNADVRFYTGANPTLSNNVGTISGPSSNTFGTTLPADFNKYYTFQLTLILNGSNVDMSARIFDGTTQVGSTVQRSILASTISLNGQVGLRVGGAIGTTEDVSRFEVYSIPEPGTLGTLGLAFGLWLISKSRARRA